MARRRLTSLAAFAVASAVSAVSTVSGLAPHDTAGHTVTTSRDTSATAADRAQSLTSTATTTTTTPAYADATALQENPARDGNAGPTNLPASLTRAWSAQLGGRVSYAVIAGGRLFVTVSRSTSAAPAVYAFAASTGQRLWGPLVVPGADTFLQLTYDAGRLYALTDQGMVEALDPADGSQLWSRSYAFGDSIQPSPPLAIGGHVLDSAGLVSFNEKTGAKEWQTTPRGGTSPVAWDGTNSYVGATCGAAAITPAGSQRWEIDSCSGAIAQFTPAIHGAQLWYRTELGLPGQIVSTADGHSLGTFRSDYAPAFSGSTVLLMTGHRLVAADATTLGQRWTQTADGHLDTNPVIAGDVAYVGSSSGTMYGFSMATGAEVWRGTAAAPIVGGDLPTGPYVAIQNPTIGDGVLAVPAGSSLTVFAASAAGGTKAPATGVTGAPPVVTSPSSVRYPDATSYQENPAHDGYAGPALPTSLHQRWSHPFNGTVGTPMIVGGRMFVPVATATTVDVYAVQASNGAAIWGPVSIPADTGQIIELGGGGGLTYDAGRLFALTSSGVLAAIDPASGRTLWSRQLLGYWTSETFAAPPTAANGIVYVNAQDVTFGVSESTGAELLSPTARGGPSIVGVNARGGFVSYAAHEAQLVSPTGVITWDTKLGEGGSGAAVVLHGSQAWVRYGLGAGDGVVLDQATGRQVRTFYSQGAPAFAGNRIILTQDGTLTGTDASTGAVQWSQAADALLYSSPVVTDTTAYITSASGTVYGFSVATGRRTWSADLGQTDGYLDDGPFDPGYLTAPIIGDGYLALPSGGRLVVFGG